MIQTQLFIDSGRQKETSYAISEIEVLSENTVYNATITLSLNGYDYPIVIDSNVPSVIAAFITQAVNATGTHRSSVLTGTSRVKIEPLTSGPQPPTAMNAGNSSATFAVTNETGIVITADPEWQSADMDAGIEITIKDSIKKAKDVGKVFTAFTLPFKLPASKANNIIFKRFSSNKIYEGFDPRRKYAARIKLNGVDFKSGYIKLGKVDMRNNQPFSYSVQFFGELASLKDTIGDGQLKDLRGLSKYTFPFTDENVILGFETGFDVVVNDSSGERETTVIQVIDPPTASGDITLAMNLIPYDLYLIGGGGTTAESTADSLANQINYIEGYGAAVYNERFVYILADDVGAQNNATLIGATEIGMTYTIATPIEGSTVPQEGPPTTIVPNNQGMFKFPFISHTRGFEYTKNADGLEGNHEGLHRLLTDDEKDNYYRNPTAPFTIGLQTDSYPLVQQDKLNRFDLKPAIKLPYIFDAISESYPSIIWDTEWLFGSSTVTKSPIKDMYMWMHNRKGNIGGGEFSYIKELKNRDAGALDGEWEYWLGSNSNFDARPFSLVPNLFKNWDFKLYVENIQGDGDMTLHIYVYDSDTLDELAHEEHTGDGTDPEMEVTLNYPYGSFQECVDQGGGEQRNFFIRTEIICDTAIGEMRPRIDVTQWGNDQLGIWSKEVTYGNGTGNDKVIVLPNIDPALLMPKYKIMDFLSDLFKMYNLVAFEVPQDDGSIKIKITSYDYYINNGVKRDITKYIDITKGTVERISPFAIVDYSFAKKSTFLAINQEEITGDHFGEASFNVARFSEGQSGSNSFLFDGGKYNVKISQEKMMFERMNDEPNKALSPIQWGWMVNDNKENVPEPVLGKPLLLYCVNKLIGGILQDDYTIEWGTQHRSTTMVIPSNVNASGEQTLHFNSEYDEYHRNINRNSLFLKYHSNMIEGIYSGFAKKIKITAHLPPLVFNSLKLSDTIIVDNISYFIDEMDINITTGKTKFSLLRVTDIKTRLEGRDEGEEAWQDADVNWDDDIRNWEVKRETT